MTLEELKIETYALIEEYSEENDYLTEDTDLSTKMNGCINIIQNEMARYKKIEAYKEEEVFEGQTMMVNEIDDNIYQLDIIKGVEYEKERSLITFKETGIARFFYYKYPERITMDTPDDYTFELDPDAVEIMPYGVAGLLLSADVSNNYGNLYTNLYEQRKQMLDPRKSMPSVYIEEIGGI